ncbi:Phosphatidylinositolglycan class N-domain-containing protein [Amylostereum chailletii]|nr:Phosphatidylinositolglycan class N-domain-containing protein [Amylostereum chailletii]
MGDPWPVARLLTLGIVFHLIYIGSVFDCYFTSPVVHGMKPHRVTRAGAKRLALIVGDGLRADFVFSANATEIVSEAPNLVAPHLRSIIETRGAYGVSHTRVPTESRPGHVAIIGGMYEDVSAVTKGWKTNPVDFDSVFNQSSHTFSFGSPDILPMFARGATPGKVKTWMYDEEDEDFTKDATALDFWVLDELKTLFHNATEDPVLDAQLREGNVVFFLHLLGLDTTGHSYRPHSKEYMNNILVVDQIVRETENLVNGFYNDQDTSFIFTADHGMSRIGNHGDGDPDNTRTPLIAWGAGIRGPLPGDSLADEYSAPWLLDHLVRRDVEQADIAALMSALLGTNWPVNSVGVLPDVDPSRPGFLFMKNGEEDLAKAGLVNAQVVLEHYRVKHEMKQRHTLYYQPFKALEEITGSQYPGSIRVAKIEDLIFSRQYRDARQKTFNLIKTTLEGLRYLETYDRSLIRAIVALAYTGWVAFSAMSILAPRSQSPNMFVRSWTPVISTIFIGLLLASWALFFLQQSSWTLFVYILFPIYFWHEVLVAVRLSVGWRRSERLFSVISTVKVKCSLVFIVVAVVLQLMVMAYTYRALWAAGFVVIGWAWPWIAWGRTLRTTRRGLLLAWTTACSVTGVFPLLKVDPSESLPTILAGGFCMAAIGMYGSYSLLTPLERPAKLVLSSPQMLLLLASMIVTSCSVHSLQAKSGLPLGNQVLGWSIFVLAACSPFFGASNASSESKLLVYFLTFCPCFVILCIRAEGLFYLSYCLTLFLWIQAEEAVRTPTTARMVDRASTSSSLTQWNPGELRMDDVRIALFFLFFVQVGFFGTGNVASVSSFYLEPVYRLVPIFNPFLMASLLIFKILAPYVLLSASFATLNTRLRMPPFALFLVALTLTDGMTMTFFFKVTDTGSWLEIGQSISHFCITSLLLVFSAGISALGGTLMGKNGLVSEKTRTE